MIGLYVLIIISNLIIIGGISTCQRYLEAILEETQNGDDNSTGIEA